MTTNEMLIDGLIMASYHVNHDVMSLKIGKLTKCGKGHESVSVLIPGLLKLHIEAYKTMPEFQKIVLPGLLRYLAGKMGWGMQSVIDDDHVPETLWDWFVWPDNGDRRGGIFDTGFGDQLTAEIEAFYAICKREAGNE